MDGGREGAQGRRFFPFDLERSTAVYERSTAVCMFTFVNDNMFTFVTDKLYMAARVTASAQHASSTTGNNSKIIPLPLH